MIEATGSIRVLLADDHAIVRNGVAQILNEERGIGVVAQAADGAEAVELFARVRPDVALVDLRMPKMEGVQVVEQIRERFPDAAIVILTTYDTDNDIERALRGARRFSGRCHRRTSWLCSRRACRCRGCRQGRCLGWWRIKRAYHRRELGSFACGRRQLQQGIGDALGLPTAR